MNYRELTGEMARPVVPLKNPFSYKKPTPQVCKKERGLSSSSISEEINETAFCARCSFEI